MKQNLLLFWDSMDKKKKRVSGINFQMIIEGTTPLGTSNVTKLWKLENTTLWINYYLLDEC